jgi:hypothetical protein
MSGIRFRQVGPQRTDGSIYGVATGFTGGKDRRAHSGAPVGVFIFPDGTVNFDRELAEYWSEADLRRQVKAAIRDKQIKLPSRSAGPTRVGSKLIR